MNLFLSGWPDSGSLLKFDLAAVRAAVRQRLCFKAIMAGIAEIVVHSVCTSNLCFIISLMFHQDTFLSQGSPQY